MSFSLRLFLGYSIIIILAGYLFYRELTAEVKPAMRQPLEEALVDAANLLAEQVRPLLKSKQFSQTEFEQAIKRFNQRKPNASIWSMHKKNTELSLYVTDARGVVLFDSRGRDQGKDYSRWNDVYLTLKGEYGARSSREDPNDPNSSVMYVAAPVIEAGRIIGVLTLGKPNISAQPFIERLTRTLLEKGLILVLAALAVGLLLSIWLTHSIRRLTHFAEQVKQGNRVEVPRPAEPELAQLANAMERMRTELEGKEYVEHYLHTLTHELKSPIAAIQGASELLSEQMPEQQRQRFVANIENESRRMKQIVERLLNLAVVEKRQSPQQVESVEMDTLVARLCEDKCSQQQCQGIDLAMQLRSSVTLQIERFLLEQAIANLLDNAIGFSKPGDQLKIKTEIIGDYWRLSIQDQGPGIPDYAVNRIFERFYSLPGPDRPKSTGIGLAFVKEVAELHAGQISVKNHGQGALAQLSLPLV